MKIDMERYIHCTGRENNQIARNIHIYRYISHIKHIKIKYPNSVIKQKEIEIFLHI